MIQILKHVLTFFILLVCSGYHESKIRSDNERNENLIFIQLLDFIYQKKNIHNSGVINYSFHFL